MNVTELTEREIDRIVEMAWELRSIPNKYKQSTFVLEILVFGGLVSLLTGGNWKPKLEGCVATTCLYFQNGKTGITERMRGRTRHFYGLDDQNLVY